MNKQSKLTVSGICNPRGFKTLFAQGPEAEET